ncbi:hypothetical protein QR680_009288 [Steinernema hermaphroditum]|uniref:EamA domain-containing protein n=1 Tax=Steinernema hermaphroditum TaxID=289476 RepID=A0AA39IL10_9BILA|nr:hypothetical protein QR680_009288 [Steinernema hermaphroditum]
MSSFLVFYQSSDAEKEPLLGRRRPKRSAMSSESLSHKAVAVATPRLRSPQAMTYESDEEEESVNCSPCCDNENVSRTFLAVVFGQFLSLCLCGTGVASQLLQRANVNAPTTQSFLNYFALCFVYGIILVFRKDDKGFLPVLRERGWKYLLLAFIDVEANFIIVMAYQYTTLTSIQLLDCSTIPMVMVLSWLFLSVRYLTSHVVGVAVCLVGIACVIVSDVLTGKGLDGGSDRFLGDMLCVFGSFLYAIANVAEEYLIKQNNSRVEYLGMVGLFGSIISGIQLAIVERNNLAAIDWTTPVILEFLLFAVCMFAFYSTVTVVMQKTSALMFNLGVLSADFYSLLFGIFLFKYEFHVLYFVSFAVVIVGSVVYSMRPTAQRDPDEPRRLLPCCFLCCWCCGCCFEPESRAGSVEANDNRTENNESFDAFATP